MIANSKEINQSSKQTIFRVLRQIAYTKLFKKYSSGNFSYNKILVNNLIFNDSCRIVARFKDYLILDDNTEFLRRFYFDEESHPKLERILNFYETYSKIFPNYMILKESKYLYRNIRKKQKMIDAVNEIKREEEENRKRMESGNKNDNEENELFTKKVKEEIKTFQENTTFQRYNDFDSDNDKNDNSISISLFNKKMFENMDSGQGIWNDKSNSKLESFVTNETNHSISGILNVLNDNKIYIKDLPMLLEINNYSKNSQNLKKHNKRYSKIKGDKQISEVHIFKNKNVNILLSSNNKLEKPNNNQKKKFEKISRQFLLQNKAISNPSNVINTINNNYISNKGEYKKSSGIVLSSNTEKNINEIKQYQNIIIPKGNTVININNNYFDQTLPSSSLQTGYYTNKNFHTNTKANKNLKNNNYKNNVSLKKSNTNNISKNKKGNIQISEKKNNVQKKFKKSKIEQKMLFQNNLNEDGNNNKKINQIKHSKQISQDYIYQKCINNDKSEEKAIKEKLIKFNSLSPKPAMHHLEIKNLENKKIKEYQNYLTENNNPNLITRNTKENDEEEEEKQKKMFLMHIRDLIENTRKESNIQSEKNKDKNNNEENILFLNKKNKIKNEILQNENKFNYSYFLKYKTISNFNSEGKDYSNILKSSNKQILEGKYFNKKELFKMQEKKLLTGNNNKENKNNIKKLQIKEKKAKIKGLIKNGKAITNYNTTSNTKMNSDNNKLFFKTNNNFKNNKNLFDNINKENSIINKDKEKCDYQELTHENNDNEDKNKKTQSMTLTQSIFHKNPSNSQLSNLLMSHKKENQYLTENNNASMKIYHKGKIKNFKNYKKENLNIDSTINNINGNNICYTNTNNFDTENKFLNNKIILTENNNNKNNNMNSNEKGKFNYLHNSEIKNGYKSYLFKKYKIKSCEFENQSVIQHKNNEIIDRMVYLKQNESNNFYQKYSENSQNLLVKNNLRNNIGSFDNIYSNNKKYENLKINKNNYNNEKNGYQTPFAENRKIGLYKKVVKKSMKSIKTEKNLGDKNVNIPNTPGTIKVNRSKFLKNAKNKIYDNNSKARMKNNTKSGDNEV